MSEKKDITDQQLHMLTALEKLSITSPEELEMLVKKETVVVKEEKTLTGKYPRISLFYGQPGKGEVSYRTWRYEVNCLLREKEYSEESLLLGIRRSLRGEAADMAMRLGEFAKIHDILTTFHSAFGNTETAESILKQFHGCTQQKDESVVAYASRIEELFSQAVELGALERRQQLILKSVFYEGLNCDLKVAALYKFDTIKDYNVFKTEIRKLESALNAKKPKPCSVATKDEKSDMGEVKSLLQQLNSRIEKLEKQNEERCASNMQQQDPGTAAGCDDSWITFQGSCYLFGHVTFTFVEARTFCEHQNAHLVRIDSAIESFFIQSWMERLKNAKFWIGLNDLVIEGIWQWHDTGSTGTYYDWNPGEPNQGTAANCAAVREDLGYNWVDDPCDNHFYALCEKNQSDSK